jgi:hypothetical protein
VGEIVVQRPKIVKKLSKNVVKKLSKVVKKVDKKLSKSCQKLSKKLKLKIVNRSWQKAETKYGNKIAKSC